MTRFALTVIKIKATRVRRVNTEYTYDILCLSHFHCVYLERERIDNPKCDWIRLKVKWKKKKRKTNKTDICPPKDPKFEFFFFKNTPWTLRGPRDLTWHSVAATRRLSSMTFCSVSHRPSSINRLDCMIFSRRREWNLENSKTKISHHKAPLQLAIGLNTPRQTQPFRLIITSSFE